MKSPWIRVGSNRDKCPFQNREEEKTQKQWEEGDLNCRDALKIVTSYLESEGMEQILPPIFQKESIWLAF